MPCETEGYGPDDKREGWFLAVLCATFSVLHKDGALETTLARADLREAGVRMAEILSWWTDHQIRDAQRRGEEAARAHKEEMAERAEYERLKAKFG